MVSGQWNVIIHLKIIRIQIWIGAFCLAAAGNYAGQSHVHRICKEFEYAVYTLFCSEYSPLWLEFLNKSTLIITVSLHIIQSINQYLESRQNIAILCFRIHLNGPYFCSQNIHIQQLFPHIHMTYQGARIA